MKTLRRPLFLAAITLAGQLYAQPAQPTQPVEPMAIQDMEKTALALSKQVGADLAHIQSLQAMARRQKDEFKLNCINEQLLAAKAGANQFDKQKHDLTNAADDSARTKAFAGVTGEGEKVHQARVNADGCVGQRQLTQDRNASTRPTLKDNPTEGGTEVGSPGSGNGGGLEPPVYESPYN